MSLEQFQLFEELWVHEFYLIVQNFRIDSKNLETMGVVESVNASPFLRLSRTAGGFLSHAVR